MAYPENKVHGANMGPTWVLSAPDGPHVGPMSIAIGDSTLTPLVLSKDVYFSRILTLSFLTSSIQALSMCGSVTEKPTLNTLIRGVILTLI